MRPAGEAGTWAGAPTGPCSAPVLEMGAGCCWRPASQGKKTQQTQHDQKDARARTRGRGRVRVVKSRSRYNVMYHQLAAMAVL